MQIKKIYQICSNRNWYNFRLELMWEKKWLRPDPINIKLLGKASNNQELVKQLSKGFKYWYDSITWEWKYHRGITASFYIER